MCEPVEILVVALFHMGGCLLHEMGLRLFARSFISPRQTNSMGVPFLQSLPSQSLSAGLLIPRFFRCKWPKNLHVALETMARWGAPAGRRTAFGQPLEYEAPCPRQTSRRRILYSPCLPRRRLPFRPAPTFCQFGHQNTIAVFCLPPASVLDLKGFGSKLTR